MITMSWITDIIKELRLLGVHREKIALIEFKLSETEKQYTLLEAENTSLKQKNANLQASLDEAHIKIGKLQEEKDILQKENQNLTHIENLPDKMRTILVLIAAGEPPDKYSLAQILETHPEQLHLLLEQLTENEYLHRRDFYGGKPSEYELTDKARKYMEANRLL